MIENDILLLILEKFPRQAQEITKMYSKSEGFRDICNDYILCMGAIRKIESNDISKEEYLRQFKEALDSLENELLESLKKVNI